MMMMMMMSGSSFVTLSLSAGDMVSLSLSLSHIYWRRSCLIPTLPSHSVHVLFLSPVHCPSLHAWTLMSTKHTGNSMAWPGDGTHLPLSEQRLLLCRAPARDAVRRHKTHTQAHSDSLKDTHRRRTDPTGFSGTKRGRKKKKTLQQNNVREKRQVSETVGSIRQTFPFSSPPKAAAISLCGRQGELCIHTKLL